jgi:hypothetical protein
MGQEVEPHRAHRAEGREIAQVVSQLLDHHAGALSDLGISEGDMSLTTRMLRSIINLWSF